MTDVVTATGYKAKDGEGERTESVTEMPSHFATYVH